MSSDRLIAHRSSLVPPMADFLQTLIVAVTIGSLYALIALGYTMVYGILKLINFAHSDVVVLGAWSSLTAASFLLPRMGVNLDSPGGPPWWAGVLILLLAMSICALTALAIERFAYKPIRKAPRLNALITAMGVSLFLQNAGQLQYTVVDGVNKVAAGKVVQSIPSAKQIKLDQPITLETNQAYLLQILQSTGAILERRISAIPGTYPAGEPITMTDPVGARQAREASYTLITRSSALKLPFGKMPDRVPNLAPVLTHPESDYERNVLLNLQSLAPGIIHRPVQIRLVDVVIVLTAVLLMVALQGLIYHTRFGMAMRAVSFSPDYAALMGIPIDRVISITFVIGAVLAAAAGFLWGQEYNQLQQTAHYAWVLLGLKAFVAAVIGGIGNIRGAVVGGFLIAFIEFFGGLYGTKWLFHDFGAYIDVVVFLLLIVVLIIKPAGLFGSTAREKV